MSEDADTWPLLQVSDLGAWIALQPYLWQMGLLTTNELARKTGTFGLGLSLRDRDIFRLWRLGLLRADSIHASNRRQRAGLVYRGKDRYSRHLYSDERVLWTRKSGIIGAAAHSKGESDTVSPHFHPFRYLVLYHLERALKSKLAPSVVLSGKQQVRWGYEFELKMVRNWSTSPQFKEAITRWDSVASLVIALEPWYSAHFSGRLSVPSYLLTEDDVGTDRVVHADHAFARLQQEIERHWEERLVPILRSIGRDRLERIHSDLCVDADLLDRNGDVHTLLMLQPAPKRLETDGQLGGALYLKTMAEILRRGTEAALGVRLREEAECGVRLVPADLKRQRYGADRILDNDLGVQGRYIREFGLNSGIYLRWYVEGTTEWGAVNSILGHQGVDVVNLRGKVA